MMRSMWSGVAGLKTHQLEMDVIGNNIANVNTTSYKAQATGFQDILYQTVKSGTGAGDTVGSTNISQVGLGSKVGSIYTNIAAQGSAVTTDNVMDIMITGPSFFVISPDISGAEMNFSRDGSFAIDANGDLVTKSNGYYVLGTMGQGGITDGATV
ncbi:MAG: flagellar hook-basal body complex protein, partial [Butyrivibrio sp.]|uniref:flagellar hook-basal body complex protein n=1 Tax=Butyrivibrio sp. TaxID=28121 RepID=UPI001B63FC75